MARRVHLARARLEAFFKCMCPDTISTPEKIEQLKGELNDYHETDEFSQCKTMGDLVKMNLKVTLGKSASASQLYDPTGLG